MKTNKTQVNKTEIGRIGTAPVVVLQGKDDDQATVCLVLEGELEEGKSKAPTRYFSKKLALIALANTDKLRAFVADPRFDPAATIPSKVVVLPEVEAPVVTNTAQVEIGMAALRKELATLRSTASGRLNPVVAA